METAWKNEDDYLYVALTGRLDGNSAPDFSQEVEEKSASGDKDLIFDFTGIDYISSAGLRVVLKTTQAQKSHEKVLVLCGLKDYVREVFDLAGLGNILDIRDSCE